MSEQTLAPSPVPPAFRICVLGPLRLERRISLPGEPARFTAIQGKALGDRPGVMLALLKSLLSSDQRHATKAWLAETLWLEVQEESALRNLRSAKHALGKLLRTAEGTSLLHETPDGLGLSLATNRWRTVLSICVCTSGDTTAYCGSCKGTPL